LPSRRKARLRSKVTKKKAFLYFLIFAVLAAALAGIWKKVRQRQKPQIRRAAATHFNRRRQSEQLMRAVETAGGEDVWIRGAPSAMACAAQASSFPHVLAAARAYGNVLRALRDQGQKQGLAVRIDAVPESQSMPASQVTFFLRREPVCRLRVEAVRRIARVAIVVDDLGSSLAAARAVLRLRAPLTLSVMPRLAHSRQTAEEAHRAGAEVMLHLPMQPVADSAPDVSPDELRVGMNGVEVARIVDQDLASVPGAAGVNNHMGSRATADRRLMAEVMAALAGRHLYFVDSRTSPDSVAFAEARRNGLPAFYRSIFLDDARTVSYTLRQLHALCRVAQERGAALAIGHPYPATLAALRRFLPELERDRVQLVPVSQIIRLREAAQLAPAARSSASKR